MHIKDSIVTLWANWRYQTNVTLWANWRYRGSHYNRIQLHRTDLHKVSGLIWIKLKSSFQGKLSIFRANFYFQGKFYPPPSKMPSRKSMGSLYHAYGNQGRSKPCK